MKETKVIVEGMGCVNCKKAVERALKAVNGVADAVVDLDSKLAVITADEAVTADQIVKAIEEDAGYTVGKID